MASAIHGAIRKSGSRSAVETLETSMAIAGEPTVRNCRTGAEIGASGEPVNFCESADCASSANFRLADKYGSCARSHGSNPFRTGKLNAPTGCGVIKSTDVSGASCEYARACPNAPVDATWIDMNTAPRCAFATALRSSNDGP